MLLATTEEQLQGVGLKAALGRWLRPAVGFVHPSEVLKDPHLEADEKRAILSSWASDASAVKDQPTQRWLLGTPEPVRDVWAMRRPAAGRLLRFRTRARAEAAALRLGERVARAGRWAEICLALPEDRAGVRFILPPAPHARK